MASSAAVRARLPEELHEAFGPFVGGGLGQGAQVLAACVSCGHDLLAPTELVGDAMGGGVHRLESEHTGEPVVQAARLLVEECVDLVVREHGREQGESLRPTEHIVPVRAAVRTPHDCGGLVERRP